MELTPDRQAKHPNSTQAGWNALASGLRCLTCFDGRGNGYCADHAEAAIWDAANAFDATNKGA